MIRNGIEAYRQLSDTMEQLARLQKRPVYDCGDGVYETVMTGAGPSDFEELRRELMKSGALLWDNTIAGNRFCGAAAEADGAQGYISLAYLPGARELRMASNPTGAAMPDRLGDAPQHVGSVRLTQVCPDDSAGNFGMCYVFALGEGHYLVYDGNGDAGNDHDKLYQCLCEGLAPGGRPVVDAWIFTHPHWDHLAGPVKFAKKYAGMVEVRNLLFNVPSLTASYFYKELGSLAITRGLWLRELQELFPDAAVYKPHTGQRFAAGDAQVEVLYTHEDLYPHGQLTNNDASLVTMVTVHGKKLFFPADVGCEKACRIVADRYGGYLKSDYYQAAHHGWDTGALAFYSLVDAPEVLWPLRKRDWERIQCFPATQVMVKEMEEQRRRFHIAWDENISIEL